jgi:pilus assembly protein CpaB
MKSLTASLHKLRLALAQPRAKSGALLLLALCLAGLAGLAAQSFLDEQLANERAALNSPKQWHQLLVAKRALLANDVVDESTVAIHRLPRQSVPGGTISPDDFEQVRGKKLSVALRSGEPLLHQHVVVVPSKAGLSSSIKQGVRAVTILVDEVNSISGLLQPGDHIDLQASIRPPPIPGQPAAAEITGLLLQNVLVLATGKQARPLAEDPQQQRPFTAITVEVDPAAAQKLIVAQRSGKLTALLRHTQDDQAIRQAPLDIFGLLSISPKPTAVAPKEIEMIVGGKAQAAALVVPVTPPVGPPPVAGSVQGPNTALTEPKLREH